MFHHENRRGHDNLGYAPRAAIVIVPAFNSVFATRKCPQIFHGGRNCLMVLIFIIEGAMDRLMVFQTELMECQHLQGQGPGVSYRYMYRLVSILG
jgi:hypothetical protein